MAVSSCSQHHYQKSEACSLCPPLLQPQIPPSSIDSPPSQSALSALSPSIDSPPRGIERKRGRESKSERESKREREYEREIGREREIERERERVERGGEREEEREREEGEECNTDPGLGTPVHNFII